MKLKNRRALVVLTLLTFILVTGCQSKNKSNAENEPTKELTVAAASNLINAFTELGKSFEQEYGIDVTFSFGSTGQLADQIEHGAPFDVFASADTKFIDKLKETNSVIPESIQVYTLGQIVIATLKDIEISHIGELKHNDIKKIAIANPEHAPYGMAAKQALEATGIWEEIEERVVYGRNISDTFTLVETGNVEAAIVALSLVNDNSNVIPIDQSPYQPLEQSIAIVSRTDNKELANEFIQYVNNEGEETMEKFGFIHLEEQ